MGGSLIATVSVLALNLVPGPFAAEPRLVPSGAAALFPRGAAALLPHPFAAEPRLIPSGAAALVPHPFAAEPRFAPPPQRRAVKRKGWSS